MVKLPNNIVFYFVTIIIISVLFLLAFNSPLKIYKEFISSIATTTLPTKGITILFVGDMMFDRNVARYAEKNDKDYILKGVEELFTNNDAVIGNLEGTITDNESISLKNNEILRFTFNTSFADFLKKYNFTAVSLANNHSSDFGRDGYEQTQYNLNNSGILSFGSASNDTNISSKIILQKKTFCFVGYHDLYTYNETPTVEEIIKVRNECDFVIVFAHWGEEYKSIQNNRQTMLAHKFIDAGADLVIGAHPHVVQPYEIYKDKAIFYSLGNFVFDQDFSYATKHALALKAEFKEEGTNFTLIPTSIEKSQVNFDESKEIQTFSVPK